jgi:hypothetical protein
MDVEKLEYFWQQPHMCDRDVMVPGTCIQRKHIPKPRRCPFIRSQIQYLQQHRWNSPLDVKHRKVVTLRGCAPTLVLFHVKHCRILARRLKHSRSAKLGKSPKLRSTWWFRWTRPLSSADGGARAFCLFSDPWSKRHVNNCVPITLARATDRVRAHDECQRIPWW